jgi:polar amino acid transport system substrate-binding protein
MIGKGLNIKLACLLAFLFLAAFFVFPPAAVQARPLAAPELTFLTEQYPPFNYREHGRLEGISVYLLEEMMKRASLNFRRDRIRLTSWTEGYRAALNRKSTVLFSTTRTPEREKLFQWVGPIAPTKIVLIARRDRALKIDSFDDLKKLKVAALRDDIGEQLLARGGIKGTSVTIRNKPEDAIRLLEAGTVDAWAYEETAGLWLIRHLAADAGNFRSVYSLHEGELYFAVSRNTPQEVVQRMQRALDDLKREKNREGFSAYEEIFDHYLKPRYGKDGIAEEQARRLVDRTAEDLAGNAALTIRRINAGEQPYRDRDNRALYVFVYDPGVTMVAHAENPKTVGINFKGKTDVDGKAFRDEIVARALKDGSGWEDYIYTHPGESGLYFKTTYFQAAKGSDGRTYIVCSGRLKAKPDRR